MKTSKKLIDKKITMLTIAGFGILFMLAPVFFNSPLAYSAPQQNLFPGNALTNKTTTRTSNSTKYSFWKCLDK